MARFAIKTFLFDVSDSATVSSSHPVESYKVFGLQMPAAFTGTAITFQAAENQNGTFVDVFDESGSQISITVSTDRYIGLDAAALEIAAAMWIRLVSNDTEVADRTVLMHMKE